MQNLVVVESAAKAKTIEKFLGRGYTVRACLGHVRDLPSSKLGVDVEHGFQPQYVIPKDRKDVVKRLKEDARGKSTVLLATDPDRVDAQQARRILDRLIGYPVSNFLGRKVRRGLSAGRVQSVAVRMVVDREKEIQAFVPVEYWTLEAELSKQRDTRLFVASLVEREGKKIDLRTGEEAAVVQAD